MGSSIRCWGSIFLSPGEPDPAPGFRGVGFTFPSVAHLEVAEGTACVIDDGGALGCFGQLTDEARYDRLEELERESSPRENAIAAVEQGPFLVRYASDVVDVAIGIEGLSWVHGSGTVKCESAAGASEAYLVPAGIDDARRIALTDEHVCVLREGGDVSCWGGDEAGIGGSIPRAGEVTTHGGLEGRDVVAGLGFTCVLRADGEVTCWGDGLLDDELFSEQQLMADEYPRYIWPDVRAVELAAGELHACARTEGGRVVCMGDNGIGQLGDGTTERRPAPVEASQLQGASRLAIGTNATCAVVEHRLRCVGDGTGGAFDGRRSPPRWAKVFTGSRDFFLDRSGHLVCAIDEQDRLRCVGDTDGGLVEAIRRRLPDGMSPTSRATAHLDGHPCTLDAAGALDCGSRPDAPAARRDVAQVVGGSRTLCVRHRDGEVACHGTVAGHSPVVSGEDWQTLESYAGATEIAVDDLGSALCAVFRSGRVACRGMDVADLGQLRNAESLAMSTGALCVATRDRRAHCIRGGHVVAPVDDVVDVAFYDLHPCMLTTRGEVLCERRGRPTRLGELSGVTRIEGRRWTLCALTEGGEVHCHGRGTSGELGLVPEGFAVEAIELDPFCGDLLGGCARAGHGTEA